MRNRRRALRAPASKIAGSQTRLAYGCGSPCGPATPCGSHDPGPRLASRRASPSLRGRRSARTIRITDSPRGARRRASAAAARLARSGSQTRLAARVAEPPRPPLGSHYHVHRLASVGGAPAPRRPAARTTRITDSPRGARRRASAAAARLALPHRGFFEGSPVPGRVGEGDRADRRERGTGVTVRGGVRAPGGGVTDRAEPAGERLGDLAIAGEGPHTFTEP